ncbi:MAG: hypothetical protein ABW175_06655, partial [Bradyrhizobium sp.]
MQLVRLRSAGVQDFHAVSVQALLCARTKEKLAVGENGPVRFPCASPHPISMQTLKRVSLILLWLAGPVLVFAAVNKNDPYLISLRGPGNIILAATTIVIAAMLIRRSQWSRGMAGRVLILLWCLPSLSMLGAHAAFEWRKQHVLQADSDQVRVLGQHFMVGYSSLPEVSALAEKGLISGVYVTRHNVARSSAAQFREEIAALQEKRRVAGLPPLVIAADQEGGIVAHLAPPLTRLPALS